MSSIKIALKCKFGEHFSLHIPEESYVEKCAGLESMGLDLNLYRFLIVYSYDKSKSKAILVTGHGGL
jgi:hypothetical protein